MSRCGAVLAVVLGIMLPGAAGAAQAAGPHLIAGVVPDTVAPVHHSPAGPLVGGRRPSGSLWAPLARAASALPTKGGRVLHSNRTHVIFWAPAGSGLSFDPGYTALVSGFLTAVAVDSHLPTNVFGLTGQYVDSTGPAAYSSTFAGAITDSDPLPANGCTLPAAPPLGTGPGWSVCLTDAQLEAEIESTVTAQHLPRGPTDVYLLVTPSGLGSCTADASGSDAGPGSCSLGGGGPSANPYQGSYCGYHSETVSGLLYAVIPYNAVDGHCESGSPRPNASTADPTLSTISHELSETITDPHGDGYITSDGQENGDLCATDFGAALGGSGQSAWNQVIAGGHFYLQDEWSNESGSTESTACQARDEADAVSARIPARVLGDRPITLRGAASDPDGQIVLLKWYFGTGAGAAGARINHVFPAAGSVAVLLASVDSADNFAFWRGTVTVVRPPAPTVRFSGGPVHGLADSSRPRFRFGSDAAIVAYSCRVDYGPARPCRSPFVPARQARGRHTLRVSAVDSFAQTSSRPAAFPFSVR